MRAKACIVLTFMFMAVVRIAQAQIPDQEAYLPELCNQLKKQWPNNRTMTIVCHGHSVPAGYFKTPVVDTFNAYPHLLHEKLKERFPYAVINVIVTAVGGENSESGARRFEKDVLAHKPDVVLIDYALNDRGLGLPRAKAAWMTMIESAKTKGVKVILLTPTADLSAKLDDPLDPLNQQAEQIRKLAVEQGVGLVDSLAAFKAYVKNGGELKDLMSQVNHPNRRGHELVAAEIVNWFPSEPGFISLFDGKTLNGWSIKCLPKDKELAPKVWTVEQGTILADTVGHKEHFYIMLVTEKEYGDFVLRLRLQVERGVRGNSGIQIRSRYNAQTGWMEGPQIDINPPQPELTGKLWNEGPGPHRWLSNEPVKGFKFNYADQGDGWNDLEITAQGMKIRSVLNGVTVVDYDGSGVLDDELHRNINVGVRGMIGLQIHSNDELKLRFKDIRIKPL